MKGCLFVCFALLGLGCDPQALLGRRLLSSCRVQAPEHTGLVVGTHTLSCPAACEILVPQPEIEPASPALEDGLSTTGPPGMSQPIASYLLLPLVDEPHWCVQSTLIHMSLFG